MPVARHRLLSVVTAVTALATVAAGPVLAQASGDPAPAGQNSRKAELKSWPDGQGRRLEKLIADSAGRGAYAVFDADNTIWRYDLEEALLPYLEMKGVLSRDSLDPSLKLIPFRDDESLYSYYVRLCEIDDKVCYPWIAQVFSGLSLEKLKARVDELFAYGKPIPVTYYDGDVTVHSTVNPPRIYPAQRELLGELRKHGITPYVMTAAHEELVRMVVSDPTYGLGIEPKNVIGVTTLLRDPGTGELTTARKQIEKGHFLDAEYPASKHNSMVITPYLWTPGTWYVGKLAGIKEYIDPYERPMLVAGDAPSDWFMLFDTDVRAGGLRLWVNRKQKYTDALEVEKAKRADEQKAAGVPVDADRNWVAVKPAEIGG
ncbi:MULTISPECIES: haloacid dehalogenase-like hydrolase [unclassified Streptomyces]|uniref:haloacid dehalogenase-like hydrolase n=1 Tax=unclassified Streptomyces TaxID=2593676 RepID=UPI001BEC4138|nr:MULTISPECIES: haloacid dehalogenase-like hydrolase [unclassified Streptomyces]MBT2405001.1 haloacid dehalogenase-like hydrolase [Streptomyces sp. ISL-21]MBT2457027.1 haloacid dehalogenase-like hydrolase [Streptomyces sp. ISL-86]MBT2610727.1 haloacid dehalogenase-like hydrolase [Streptomyces sp. ISL-87]